MPVRRAPRVTKQRSVQFCIEKAAATTPSLMQHQVSKDYDPEIHLPRPTRRQLLRLFVETTSIRGARRIIHSESRVLRTFWSVYVFVSLLLVFFVSFFCIESYARFQTVMLRHKENILGKDFPVITLCSDFFIGDNGDARALVHHPPVYSQYINRAFHEALAKRKFNYLPYIRRLNTTLMYNVNNIHLWDELMNNLLAKHVTMEFGKIAGNHTDVWCFVGGQDNIRPCRVRPFLDLRYRNCISVEVSAVSFHFQFCMQKIGHD